MNYDNTKYLKNLQNSLTLRVTPRQWAHLIDCTRLLGYRSISEYLRQIINNDICSKAIVLKTSNKTSEPHTYENNSHN